MSIFNGKKIALEIYGESHAERIGVKVKGYPKMQINMDALSEFLKRRQAKKAVYSTSRIEGDLPIFTGLDQDKIDGEFTAEIINSNKRSNDYNSLYGKPRPSHADYAWSVKDGVLDFSGGGRFSGRLTAPFCIAGGIAKQYLESLGIKIEAYVSKVGKVQAKSYKSAKITVEDVLREREGDFPSLSKKQEIIEEITNAKVQGDSVGGKVECVVNGIKAGLGDNLFSGLEGKISYLCYAIPAVKSVEFGLGEEFSESLGSVVNDSLYFENQVVKTKTNNSGGINGGITNGSDITLAVTFRPTPSISKEQDSVDLVNKTNVKIQIQGRHDSCIVPRAVPVVESAVAIALLDEIL